MRQVDQAALSGGDRPETFSYCSRRAKALARKAKFNPIPSPGRWFVTDSAHGALGYSLPGGVGAQFARPNSKCVDVLGNDSFGFSVGELETIARLNPAGDVDRYLERHLRLDQDWPEDEPRPAISASTRCRRARGHGKRLRCEELARRGAAYAQRDIEEGNRLRWAGCRRHRRTALARGAGPFPNGLREASVTIAASTSLALANVLIPGDAVAARNAHVELIDLWRVFNKVVAVENLSLTIRRGEFFSLLGPSGCGKTTTLRMIGGFETPTSGEIRLQGVRIDQLPPERRPTNMVFQQLALFPHLTVTENVAFGLRLKRQASQVIARRVEDALALVDLPAMARAIPCKSPAANSNALRSRARSSTSPRCSSRRAAGGSRPAPARPDADGAEGFAEPRGDDFRLRHA